MFINDFRCYFLYLFCCKFVGLYKNLLFFSSKTFTTPFRWMGALEACISSQHNHYRNDKMTNQTEKARNVNEIVTIDTKRNEISKQIENDFHCLLLLLPGGLSKQFRIDLPLSIATSCANFVSTAGKKSGTHIEFDTHLNKLGGFLSFDTNKNSTTLKNH